MDLEKAKEIFDKLYANVDGRSLSLKGREDQQLTSKAYVYGEVVPNSFFAMLTEVDPRPGQVFYDLGSGTGKAVMLSHLLFPFAESKGIELVDGLYNASAEVLKHYEKDIRPTILNEVDDRKVITFHGDFFKFDVSDADVIFMNSTCFPDELMEGMNILLESTKPHTHIISLSKPLKPESYYQYKSKMFDFSWGQATAFFHRKRLWKVYM